MNFKWRVEMLGGLRVSQGGQAIPRFQTQKTASLLAYLACFADRTHPREAVMEILWPDCEPDAGRNRLRVALSTLRRALEPPGVPPGAVLISDRSVIGLNPAAVITDVAELESALQSAADATGGVERTQRLADALALYQHPLLPGFPEDWIPAERQRLATLCLHGLMELSTYLEKADDYAEAMTHARRAMEIDSNDPSVSAQLQRLSESVDWSSVGSQETATDGITPDAEPAAQDRDAGTRRDVGGKQEAVPSQAPGVDESPSGRAELTAGTAAFLLMDFLTGEAPGSDFIKDVQRCREIIRRQSRRFEGFELTAREGTFTLVFPKASSALACALACRDEWEAQPDRPASRGRALRMAVAMGEVGPHSPSASEAGRPDSLMGAALRRAALILQAAHARQILCGEQAASLLGDGLPPSVKLKDLGVFRLQGGPAPVRLFQVDAVRQAPDSFPPIGAEPVRRARLPLRLSLFFGREAELGRLMELVQRSSVRLVTITGPGGCGKTRLAIESARRLADSFGGAVWFAGLSEATEAGQVLAFIARAMDLPEEPADSLLDRISRHLAGHPALLILDNLEQLPDHALPTLGQLLAEAPSLTCVATSRHRLRIDGEHEFPLSPLPVPPASASVEELDRYPSVRLFVDRAQSVRPDFRITERNHHAVGGLCSRLEGLPLALELASGRMNLLSPQQMLERMADRFTLLAGGRRDVPPRHRSLRAAIDTSFQLLPPDLQRLWGELSVFRNGFTLPAAEAVCGGIDLGGVSELVSCSLLSVNIDGPSPRFQILESLAEYGWLHLPAEQRIELDRRHARWCLHVAEQTAAHLAGPRTIDSLREMETELGNLERARLWAAEQDPETALRLALALSPFRDLLGEWDLGRNDLRAAVDAAPAAPVGLRARCLSWIGLFALRLADLSAARSCLEAGLQMSCDAGDSGASLLALRGLGDVALAEGRFAQARSFHEVAWATACKLEHGTGIAASLRGLGDAAAGLEDDEAGAGFWNASLQAAERACDLRACALAALRLAAQAIRRGDATGAQALGERSLRLFQETEDQPGERAARALLASITPESIEE